MRGFVQRIIIHVPHKRSAITRVLQPSHPPFITVTKDEQYLPLLSSRKHPRPLAGNHTHNAYSRRDGQAELTWLHTERDFPADGVEPGCGYPSQYKLGLVYNKFVDVILP